MKQFTKRILATALVVCMLLCLGVPAALAAEVDQTEQKINAIGTVTTGSGADIAAARAAYDALTESEKTTVNNYEKLTAAEAAFTQVSQFAECEDISVEYLFGKNLNPNVTTSLQGVTFAMTKDNLWEYATGSGAASSLKFNAGTQIQMNFTSTGANWLGLRLKVNRSCTYTLSLSHVAYNGCTGGVYLFPAGTTDNETLYTQVKAEVEQRSNVTSHYVDSIDYTTTATTVLGTETFLDAGEYIIAFNMLERTSGNYGKITGLTLTGKAVVANEAVEAVKDLIDAIGEVTLDSETAITEARTAYTQLTAEQQKQIDISHLTAAEQALAELKPTTEAKIGNTPYATVSAAIEAAKSGDVIELQSNVTTESVSIPEGVTLDLNGKTLTADVKADLGIVTDSTDGEGSIVGASNVVNTGDNEVALMQGNVCRIFDYELTVDAAPVEKTVEEKTQVSFWFHVKMDEAAYAMLGDSKNPATGLTVGANMQWTPTGGETVNKLVAELDDSEVTKWAGLMSSGDYWFYVNVTGFESLTETGSLVVVPTINAVAGNAITYSVK